MNRFPLALTVALTCGVTACIRSHDPMVMLADEIESRARSLRTSVGSSVDVSQSLSPSDPWVMIFVPKDGLDTRAAVREGIREDELEHLTRGLEKWGGAAVILYGSQSTTSINRLPDAVDVPSPIVLHGNAGEVQLAIHLSREANEVEIVSVRCNPCGGRN